MGDTIMSGHSVRVFARKSGTDHRLWTGPILGRTVGVEQVRAKLFKLLLLPAVIVTTAFGCVSHGSTAVFVGDDPAGDVIRISGPGGTTGVLNGLVAVQ